MKVFIGFRPSRLKLRSEHIKGETSDGFINLIGQYLCEDAAVTPGHCAPFNGSAYVATENGQQVIRAGLNVYGGMFCPIATLGMTLNANTLDGFGNYHDHQTGIDDSISVSKIACPATNPPCKP